MATPMNKGKTVKLKKSDVITGRLNTTKGTKSAATPKNAAMNFSYLNNSVTRQTLRANNRALAQGLARLKLELRQERVGSMQLRAENQELKLDASRLRRLVGLKDEQIDEEVKKRMKEQFAVVSDLVERAVSGHLSAGKSLTDLQDRFIEIQRQTPSSSNRNSITDSTEKEAACSTKQSSDSRDRCVEDGSARNLFDGLPPVPSSVLTSRHTDISMIAEQSILVEPNTQGTEPQQPSEKKTSPEMTTVPKKKAKKTSKMPQRVPSKQKYQPTDFSRPGIADKSKTKEKLSKTSDNRDPFNQKQTLHQSPKKRTISDPDLDPFKPTRTLIRSPHAGDFVRHNGIKESPPEKIDSRDFLACLVDNTAGILDEPLPGPTFEEDSTQFFNSDMELTSVIDMSRLAPPSSKSPNLPIELVEETTESNAKNDVLTVRGKNDKTGKTAVKSTKSSNDKKVKQAAAKTATEATVAADSDQADQASVEVKSLKPGVFTFSVSRKETDGSRKPVPDKKSQARSKKKKPKVVEEEPRKTDDRDMFNFGDRTPTVPLEKLQKPASTVYDVSMNESSIAPQTSLNSFREIMKDKDKLSDGTRVQPVEEDKQKKGTKEPSNIYYLPLKGCEDDEPSEKQSRSRSRSRKRIKSEEDEDWVPEKQSKPRSRSRKRTSSGDEDDWVPSHRSKSRSRAKKRISSEADDENAEEKLQPSPKKRSKSVIETESLEKPVRRSARSRSRPRELEGSENKAEHPTRSKSRQRKPSGDDSDKEEESSGPANTEARSRSRSIVRRGKNDQSERVSTRSKSRPRELKDTDDEASPVEVTAEKSCERSKPETEEENMHKGVQRLARSRSRVRKNEEKESPKKEILEKQSRRRSLSESEDQPVKEKESVKGAARSKSRPRIPVESDNEEQKSQGKSESEGRQSRPKEKADLRKSGRSKSRPRLAVGSDNEENSAKDSSEMDSRQSRPMEKAALKRSTRSKSRPRLTVDSDNEESSPKASIATDSRQSRPAEKAALRKSARSKSRPRIVVLSDNEESPVKSKEEKDKRSKSKFKCDTKDSVNHSDGLKSDIDIPTDSNEERNESHLTERSSPRKSKAYTKDVEINASENQTETHVERNSKSDYVKELNNDSCDPTNKNSHNVIKNEQKKDLDPNVYYMPLKGSPATTEKPKRSRSRSRSRAREPDPDENSKHRRRSERRTTYSESEDKDELEVEELLKKVSVRSRGTRKRDTHSNEHKESVDTGLVLPDFVFSCDSPVKHTGDQDNKVSEEKSDKKSLNSKELLTDMDDEEEVILLTPTIGTEEIKSRLSKSTKIDKSESATQGNSKSARKQTNETVGSRSKSKSNRNRIDSPVKDVIDVEEIEKHSVKSKSKSTKKKVKDPKKSGETGLVLPKFILSPDIEITNSVESENFGSEENARLSVPLEQKVLKDRNSDINIGSDIDVTKRSRQKRDSKKLSTKTPKSEQDDFKEPKTRTVKGKSSRKNRAASCKSAEKKVVNSSDTPNAESDGNPDNGAKVSRKRLDRKFVEPEDFEDGTPGQERSPASRKKIPRRDGSDSGHRIMDKGDTNDENEQPMNTLAKLKQKLSMISSKHRQSDYAKGDGDAGHQTEEEQQDNGATDEDHEDQGKRRRRNKQAISYCPKPLNSKLRRGDDMFEKKALSKENAEKARLIMSKKMLNP